MTKHEHSSDTATINSGTVGGQTADGQAATGAAAGSNGQNVGFHFDAFLNSGPLAGTFFEGTGSYNATGETGVGEEYLTLTSLNFKLDGVRFTHADIYQGGQAVLENGVLIEFTAAMLAPSSNSPVTQIVFGFGPLNEVSYGTSGNLVAGSGVFFPEPGHAHAGAWQS